MPTVQEDKSLVQSIKTSTHFTNYMTMVDEVNSIFLPRRRNANSNAHGGDDTASLAWTEGIFEAHPMIAARTLAMGQFDLLFTGDWFETKPPRYGEKNKRREEAYDEVGRIMMEEIMSSNFRLEVQEFLVDRSVPHTGMMLTEGIDGEIVHTHVPVGNYAILDDYKGYVETVVRWFKLTARQAAQKFNVEGDVLPKKVKEALKANSRHNEEFTFYHVIQRNYDRIPNSESSKDKLWSSRYHMDGCEEGESHIRISGYDEQPFIASRFDRWGDGSPYGAGPSFVGIYPARMLQVAARDISAFGSLVSDPKYFRLEDEDDVDKNTDTVVSEREAIHGYPRPKVVAGNLPVTAEIVNALKRQIDDLFFTSFIRLLTSDIEQKREKTATEVLRMLDEQVAQAGPTFARLEQETLKPYLKRVFGILLRQGKFNHLLDGLDIEPLPGGKGDVKAPEVIFTSKLANMMKVVQSNNFRNFLIENMAIMELAPDKFAKKFNLYLWLEDSWRNNGLPEKFIIDQKIVDEQDAQEQQIQAMATGLQGGEVASKISKNISG